HRGVDWLLLVRQRQEVTSSADLVAVQIIVTEQACIDRDLPYPRIVVDTGRRVVVAVPDAAQWMDLSHVVPRARDVGDPCHPYMRVASLQECCVEIGARRWDKKLVAIEWQHPVRAVHLQGGPKHTVGEGELQELTLGR